MLISEIRVSFLVLTWPGQINLKLILIPSYCWPHWPRSVFSCSRIYFLTFSSSKPILLTWNPLIIAELYFVEGGFLEALTSYYFDLHFITLFNHTIIVGDLQYRWIKLTYCYVDLIRILYVLKPYCILDDMVYTQ